MTTLQDHAETPTSGRRSSRLGSFLSGAASSLRVCLAVGLVCVVTVFYLEENWRGKRAWASCKRELEAKGRRLDWKTFIPAEVPDDLNAFKSPMISSWFGSPRNSLLSGQMSHEVVFASLKQGPPPLAEVTILPPGETDETDADLELRYGAPVLALKDGPPAEIAGLDLNIPLLAMDQVPLLDAVKNLARHCGFSLLIEPGVADSAQGFPPVSFSASNVSAFATLVAMLQTNHLQWVEDPPSHIHRVAWRFGRAPNLYVTAAARDRIQKLVADSTVPSATSRSVRMLKGAVGKLVLYADTRGQIGAEADRSHKTRTARIVIRGDFPAAEISEVFQGRQLSWTPAPSDLRVRPVDTNRFNVFANPPGFCRAFDYLAATDRFEREFDVMRDAVKRPFARMDGPYDDALDAPIPNFIALRTVAQVLSQRAQSHLLVNEPDAALRDLALMRGLGELVENKPAGQPITLVAGMIDVAITGLWGNTIAEGFQLGSWKEPHLRELEQMLSRVRLLSVVGGGIATERAGACSVLETASAARFASLLSSRGAPTSIWDRFSDPVYDFLVFAPRGWVYLNMATVASAEEPMWEAVDAEAQRVHPKALERAGEKLSQRFAGFGPRLFLAKTLVPNVSRAWQVAAKNQTLVNQGLAACALERYRMARGAYPPSLAELVPQFTTNLPNDVVTGAPLRYQRTADGRFVLYSVGWDEMDDGGVVEANSMTALDQNARDWIWPQFRE